MAEASTTLSLSMDPAAILAALRKVSDETKKLSKDMEDALGKDASRSIADLQQNAEAGANRITAFFNNASKQVKESLKTALDVGSIMAGANFARALGQGVSQVLEMEKAFDRLNVRLGLSADRMAQFKAEAGRVVSATGLNIKDVAPGISAAAARGNVRDPQQLTGIAEALAQAKNINPELDVANTSEDVAEILKRQGVQMNAQNFRSTLDAIQSATVNGGFRSSNDAAQSITAISPYAQQLGLGTRDLAGLSALASKAGDSGQGILQQLLQGGVGPDKGARLNGVLGAQLFKNGKLDTSALSQINTNQFAGQSPQILESVTGITGASGNDLKLFIDTLKQNMGVLGEVAKGSNETATQFETATNNLASKIDMFKARVTNAGQAIGDSLVEMANGIMKGDPSHKGFQHLGSAISDNAGDLAAAGGLTLGAGLLMGGGIRGLIGSTAAQASGIERVYVVNAAEIAGGGLIDKYLPTLGGIGSKAGGLLSRAGGAFGGLLTTAGGALGELGSTSVGGVLAGEFGGVSALGGLGLAAAGVAGAGYGGYKLGQGINYATGNEGGLGEKIYDWLNPDEMKMAVKQGVVEGHIEANANKAMTKPGPLSPRH